MSSFAEYLGVDGSTRPLKIGKSFSRSETPYHSVRCDFKPASVDYDQNATLEVGANDDVTLEVPSEGDSATTFRGSQKPHLKECVLIIDHKTGEITIERLGSQMQLKKTRANGQSKTLRPPYPFDKKKLSPLSGSGTPTRSETPPVPVKNGHGNGNGNGHAPPGPLSTLLSESEDSDDDLVLPDKPRAQVGHSPRGPRPAATVVAKKQSVSESSASSESDSNSSSSSSSSEDSSDEETTHSPPKNAPQLHNMPVIGDDLELPTATAPPKPKAAPAPAAKRNILTEDLQLSDSDSDSD